MVIDRKTQRDREEKRSGSVRERHTKRFGRKSENEASSESERRVQREREGGGDTQR